MSPCPYARPTGGRARKTRSGDLAAPIDNPMDLWPQGSRAELRANRALTAVIVRAAFRSRPAHGRMPLRSTTPARHKWPTRAPAASFPPAMLTDRLRRPHLGLRQSLPTEPRWGSGGTPRGSGESSVCRCGDCGFCGTLWGACCGESPPPVPGCPFDSGGAPVLPESCPCFSNRAQISSALRLENAGSIRASFGRVMPLPTRIGFIARSAARFQSSASRSPRRQ